MRSGDNSVGMYQLQQQNDQTNSHKQHHQSMQKFLQQQMTTYNTNPIPSNKQTKKNIKANSYINGINDKSKTPNNMIL
jgi:hypothetical protein